MPEKTLLQSMANQYRETRKEVFQKATWAADGSVYDRYEDVRTIALHRLQRAEVLYEPARRKPGFDIDAYITSGQFGVIAGDPIRLRAVFTRAAGEHLFETPLNADQVLTSDADGRFLLLARCRIPARRRGDCLASGMGW